MGTNDSEAKVGAAVTVEAPVERAFQVLGSYERP